MKNKVLTSFLAIAFCCLITLEVSAKDKDEIVLKDGKVLKKPYIISRTPSGLNIGHERGVIFVPFSKMSKKRQKQFNYDPKKSKAHKARIAKAQRNRQIRIAKGKQTRKTDSGSFSYGPETFPEKSTSSLLEDELATLLREKARLQKEYSQVSSGRILPSGGPSDNVYISYRGGKVYRKKRNNYGKNQTKNSLAKRKRLKEINSELQKNIRRTHTVRNLIKRQTYKGIKKGKTVRY